MPENPLSSHRNLWLFGVLFILCIYGLIRLSEGSGVFIRVHDNLDGTVAHLIALAPMDGMLSANSPVPQILNGTVSASAVVNLRSLDALVYRYLPGPTAYGLLDLLVRLIAAIGLWLVLRRFPGIEPFFIAIAALAWGLLPFYSIFGLSVAGVPLLVAAALRVHESPKTAWPWLAFLLFPFLSRFILTGAFLVGFGAVAIIATSFRLRRLPVAGILAWGLFLGGELLANADLFVRASFILSESQRSEFALSAQTFGQSVKTFGQRLLFGHYHGVPGLAIPFLAGVGMMALHLGWSWFKRRSPAALGLPLLLLATYILLALVAGFYDASFLAPLKSAIPLLSRFRFDRVYLFLPLLSVFFLFSTIRLGLPKMVVGGLLLAWLVVSSLAPFSGRELSNTVTSLAFSGQGSTTDLERVRFREYYLSDQFLQVRQKLPADPATFRTLCLGFAPAVAVANGLYSLDGYVTAYPAAYKAAFRSLIAPELAKSPRWSKYFDDWGNRCYLFAAELPENYLLNRNAIRFSAPELSWDQLEKITPLPVYLLSTARLDGPMLQHYECIEGAESGDPGRSLWVYLIHPNPLK